LRQFTKFYEAYKELIPCAYESLNGINRFITVVLEPIHKWVNKEILNDQKYFQSSIVAVCAVLDSSLLFDTPQKLEFFSHRFQNFILNKIRDLNEAGISLEACGCWSSIFLILDKFIKDARDVFGEYLPRDDRIMQNGGTPSTESYTTFVKFFNSNIVFNSLIMDIIEDWNCAYLAALKSQLEDFEPKIRYVQIYDLVRRLKDAGFFKPKGYEYYETLFGKEIVRLAKDFMPIK